MEENWDKVKSLTVQIDEDISHIDLARCLFYDYPQQQYLTNIKHTESIAG